MHIISLAIKFYSYTQIIAMLTYSYIATDHFYTYNKTLIIININSVAPLYSTNNYNTGTTTS